MLQLRKILLLDKLYIILFIFVLLVTIVRLNIKKDSIYNDNSTQAIGIITNIIYDDNKINIYLTNREKLFISYYSKKKIKLVLGDKIKVKGTFSSSTDYLKRKKIYYTVSASSIIKIKNNNNLYYYIKQIIINHLGNNPYLNTFLLGDKHLINRDVIRSYQYNGISHLFAISGMHISLIALIISKLLKKYVCEEKLFRITSTILILYLLLVGFSPSILRGVLFYIFFSINRIYYFYIKSVNLFLLIISISLLFNPNYIFDIGFQYSYLISLSLLSLSSILKSSNYFISLLKVSLISFIVSIPISLYNFYQVNILSIIYNLFFVPLISIIVFPLSLITFFIKPLEPIYNLIIILLEKISLALSKIDIGIIIFKKLPIPIYLIYFLLVILFILYKNKKCIILLFLLLIIHFFIPYFSNTKYVEFVDVGQGDLILLHINKENIMIDTGGNKNNDLTNNTIIPMLKSNGIKKMNKLIISHGDYDHMGEAIKLVNNFKVEKVIFNCGEFNDLEKELIKVLDKKKIKYYSCVRELNIDKNKLYFLNTKEYDNENDNSNVIYTELDGYKFMFMGDAGLEKEKDILDKYNISNVDVLKVGHHGSKTSSGKEFINDINPKYSIISVGKNNRYGHPNKEVLNTLENSKIYRTDQDGSIMFKIKNNKLEIKTCVP